MIKTRYETDYLPTIKRLAETEAELELKNKALELERARAEQERARAEQEKRTNAELLAEVMRLKKALGEA